MVPRLAALFVVGTLLGSLVNWAIYTFAWWPRPISPWGAPPPGVAPRGWADCCPVFGWLRLRREDAIHGRWFWLRPLLVELGTGAAVAALYWWEVGELGLDPGAIARTRGRARAVRCISNLRAMCCCYA